MANAQNPTKLTATEVNPNQTAGRAQLGEFAPKFAELNDDVLFGEVWSRTNKLSKRDRSIVTVTALVSSGIIDQSLGFHLQEAKKTVSPKLKSARCLPRWLSMPDGPRHGARSVKPWKYGKTLQTPPTRKKIEQESIFPIGEPTLPTPNILSETAISLRFPRIKSISRM